MKKVILLSAAAAGLMIALTAATMSDNGKAGVTGSPGELDCTDCHNSYTLNSGGGSVTLTSSNMTSFMYDPGVTYHMTVTVARSANSLFGLGVEALDASNNNAGTLVITNSAQTQIKTKTVSGVVRRNVVHQLNAGSSAGSHAFNFDCTAPASNIGNVTFYFAGVAANGTGNENGDYVYVGSQIIAYNTNNGVFSVGNSKNLNVFPNPVLDHFTLDFNVENSGPVDINLYNMNGQLVSNLASKELSSGKFSETFTLPANITAGNYLVGIQTNDGIITKKLMIQ